MSYYKKPKVCSTCSFAKEYKNSSDVCWCSLKKGLRKVMEPPCSAYPKSRWEIDDE